MMARLLGLWGPVVFWLAVTVTASSQSDVGPVGRIPDWVTHGLEYCVLGLLLSRALAGGLWRPLRWTQALLVVASCTLWGVSDEWHQSFVPNRESSSADVLKDFAGASLAVGLWRARWGSRHVREGREA